MTGSDFYYQFKLSEYLTRGNAKYIHDNTYLGPYFRASLHRAQRNRQHRRLREHAQLNPNTYYVAPEIANIEEFKAAFLASQLTNRCRIIPLTDCEDLSDNQQHYITFEANKRTWALHSDETMKHEKSFFGSDLEELYRRASPSWERIDEGFAIRMFNKTAESARRLMHDETRQTDQPIVPLLDFNPANRTREDII